MNQRKQELEVRALEAQRLANIVLSKERGDELLWTQSVWCIRGDQNRPYRIAGFDFMKEIIRSQAQTVAVMASAGVGKTEGFIPWSLCKADWGLRVLYLSENDLKTGLIVQERVNPNFRTSPYLQRRNQGEVDNVHLKKLGSGFVYFLGMNSDSVTRSYHGDVAVFDEYDTMEPQRIMDMQKRLSSSTLPIIREISNPSRPDVGIHRRYKEGDMRRWNVTADCCGKELPLDYQTHIDRKRLILVCPACQKPLVARKARWIPTNPSGLFPSYHIHRLMAPVLNIEKLVADLGNEDWRVVSAATRMDLGLPYEDKDSGLSDSDLAAAKGADLWSKHAPGGFISVDPGGLFDIQLWTKAEPGIPSQCCYVGTVSGWIELAHFIQESGVVAGVIDYGPDGVQSREFCAAQRALGRFFMRVAYTKVNKGENAGEPDWEYDRNDELLIQAARTQAIDTMVMKIRKGKMKFPSRVVIDSKGRWAEHMKSPRRIVAYSDSGKASISWHHEETRPDHQFHASVYASIFQEVFSVRSGSQVKVFSKGFY